MNRIKMYRSWPLLLLLVIGCAQRESETTVHQGEVMPSFNLLLSDSMTYNTDSIPAGKASVLFYFSPSCPYSRAQMTEIVENIHSLKDIQFYIITTFSFADMLKFYSTFQLERYKNIAVGRDTSNYFARYFEVKGVPTLAVYNKDKKLNGLFLGQVTTLQLKVVANESK